MIRVSSAEFSTEMGSCQDVALSQPVIVTRKGRDREVLGIEDFTDVDIEAVRRAEPSRDAEIFNREVG